MGYMSNFGGRITVSEHDPHPQATVDTVARILKGLGGYFTDDTIPETGYGVAEIIEGGGNVFIDVQADDIRWYEWDADLDTLREQLEQAGYQPHGKIYRTGLDSPDPDVERADITPGQPVTTLQAELVFPDGEHVA